MIFNSWIKSTMNWPMILKSSHWLTHQRSKVSRCILILSLQISPPCLEQSYYRYPDITWEYYTWQLGISVSKISPTCIIMQVISSLLQRAGTVWFTSFSVPLVRWTTSMPSPCQTTPLLSLLSNLLPPRTPVGCSCSALALTSQSSSTP